MRSVIVMATLALMAVACGKSEGESPAGTAEVSDQSSASRGGDGQATRKETPRGMQDALRPVGEPRTAGEGPERPASAGGVASPFEGLPMPLDFRPEPGWVEETPANPNFRLKQYRLPRVEGDEEDGEVAVFVFPGAGGSVEANIDRWIGMFAPQDGKPASARAKRKTFEVVRGAAKFPVHALDVAGHYVAAVMPGAEETHDKKGHRLIAFIIETPDNKVFVKATGPASTMERWAESLEAFVRRACAGPPFRARAGWRTEEPTSPMRVAQFTLPRAEGEEEDGEVLVFRFPGGAGSVEANFARWSGQFTQPDGRSSEEAAETSQREVAGIAVHRLEIAGRYVAAVMPGATERHDREGWKMIAFVLSDPAGDYYVRALGPRSLLDREESEIDAFVDAACEAR